MRDFVINSDLITEWNWDKNNKLNLNPNAITLGSGKKPWWICKHCGHEWSAAVYDRSNGKGCPNCARKYQTSSQEMKLFYYINKYFTDAISSYSDKDCEITELDVYIPSLQVGIEYDGATWHQDITKDKNKDIVCNQQCIKIIRIREPKCPKYESNCLFVYLKDLSMQELKNAIVHTLQILNVDNADVDFDRDFAQIENNIVSIRVGNSLSEKCPEIATEWHPLKNGFLKPEHCSVKSERRVWWKCIKCGHEYAATISNRTDKKSGCSVCAGNYPKRVYCYELGQVFESIGEAERQTGVFHGHISRCISGKLKHAGRHPTTGERLTWQEINI